MYSLYGDLGSGSCIVEMVLSELEIDYQFHQVPLDSNAQKHSDYISLNPQGKIPTLVSDNGNVMTESAAIILWLNESHTNNRLLPAIGSNERSQALRWLLFLSSEVYPMVEIADYPERFSPAPTSIEETRTIAAETWRTRWLIVEENVKGPYLLGDMFCLTDIYLAVLSRWVQQDSWRNANVPKLQELTETVSQRPLCAEIWKTNFKNR